MPFFSIIMPTYNQSNFIGAAIQSVLDQSFKDWELIIVNNFSTDETVKVISNFADNRIKVINFRNNGIIAASRNKAAVEASGSYLAFLDSDDVWYEEKLTQIYNEIYSKSDIIYHSEIWKFQGKETVVKKASKQKIEQIFESLLFFGNHISTSAVVLKAKVFKEVGGFSEDSTIVTAEDYDLWVRLAHRGFNFQYLDKYLSVYRVHSGGNSKRAILNRRSTLNVILNNYRQLNQKTLKHRLMLSYGFIRLALATANDFLKSSLRYG